MGHIIAQTRIERLTLDPGWYKAIVVDVSPVESEFGPQLEWRFMLDGHEGKTVRAWSGAKFAPGTKLYSWAEAVFGKAIPGNYNLDTDHLKGRKVDIRLEQKAGPRGTFMKVTQLAKAGSMSASTNSDDNSPF